MTRLPNAASVALLHREKVLLIQRARAPWLGMWSLPGGRLEAGEDAETCATRELQEELGLAVYALRPVTRLTLGEEGRFLLQVFATEAFEGEIMPSDEIAAFQWISPHQSSSLPTTPQLGDVLERAFRLFDRS
jgi:ADP-ribose pyrophosphatase YjhB (NUDIX family)